MTRRLDDPQVVREQYATEHNLRARAALWRDIEGHDAKAELWEVLAGLSPRRVLEVGGGDGWLSARLVDELGCDVTMVDQSERMVELASGRGLDARVGDVQALPFADASFDTAIAAWMLYHVQDIDRALAELARVLVPEGRLVALTNSRRHCQELFDLIAYPQERRQWVFNAENGEETLRRHFASVERRDLVARATVQERETLVAYQQSMSLDTEPVPDDVRMPFQVHARAVIFVAGT